VLKETFRTVAAVHAAAASIPERITLTYPTLNAAACVLYLVSGSEKAKIVKLALSDHASGVPAAMVRPTAGRLLWILDRPAASMLAAAKKS
jgi:6-phosphogluconolactonase